MLHDLLAPLAPQLSFKRKILTVNLTTMLNRLTRFTVVIKRTLSTLNSSAARSVDITTDSVLSPLSDDISHVAPYLKPTYNVACYANRSEIVQELIKLGVDWHSIEQTRSESVPELLRLKLDDVKPFLIFFKSINVNPENFGHIITKNPNIFKEQIENLEVRVNYLKSKKFTDEAIANIVTKNPGWLSYTTEDIDKKLGFVQGIFNLSGDQVRDVATNRPQLITYNQQKLKKNIFSIKEEMGFTNDDMKQMLKKRPSLFTRGCVKLLKAFDYLHNTMEIPIQLIAAQSEILTTRERRLKERHQFLMKLGRAQYDPKKPNYVSLLALASGTDSEFAVEYAKSSPEEFNMFLKTL